MIGAIIFLIVPLLGTTIFLISKRIRRVQAKVVKEQASLAGYTTETLRNVELVKSLGLEVQEINRLNKVNDNILKLELQRVKLVRTMSFIQGTLLNGLRALIMFAMLWLMFEGNISLGEFFTLLFYSFFLFSPLAELSRVAEQYQQAKASNSALEEVLNMPPESKPANPTKVDSIKSLNFKDVDFNYDSNTKSAVENININIKAGETVAFVGPSGSGKTTLIKLLVGLYKPTNGKMLINNETDFTKIDFEKFRKRIGLVSQETQLFSGTIRENLLFVSPKASDKDCMEALGSAAVANILDRGEKGLDTKIGEGGMKLSGGERQRLAIARALLRNPNIIIFDEATSSLDSLTEQEITKTILEIEKTRPDLITILVAHRLSTIAHAEKIYVLEKGRIIEKGKHGELVTKAGLYAALWRQQASLEE
jgi:ATP-binding cassette subfamily B protein